MQSFLNLGTSLLSYGWGQLGEALGTEFTWYHNSDANTPIDPAKIGGDFLAYFDRDPNFPARKAAEYGKPEWYVAYSRAGPSVGDYLASSSETYFIVDQADLTPSKVIKCNLTVDFYRVQASPPISNSAADIRNFQQANTQNKSHGEIMASGFPIAIISGSRGEKAVLELPDEGRQPWWTVFVPEIPGVFFRTDDQFVDTTNNIRYVISTPEHSHLGWRLTAQLAQG